MLSLVVFHTSVMYAGSTDMRLGLQHAGMVPRI